jgi:hypothetical protein
MNTHHYILEPYRGMNTRYLCPSCQYREKTFSRYINTLTKKHVAPTVGRCNRESNCGYHYTPKQYFRDNNIPFDMPQDNPTRLEAVTSTQKPVSFIPPDIFKQSLKSFEVNNFVLFLSGLFGTDITNQLIETYFIGTSKHWNGATVFWQIDVFGNVRTGKIMLYDANTGKRVKEPFNYISWAHKVMKQPEFELKQCLFGEHLLRDKSKPVAIVESEKTALIASVYLPEFIWLASGGKDSLKAEKCKILKGHNVFLFPDLNSFEKWKSKAKELENLAHFIVSDLIEHKASEAEKKQGLDIADYLIRYNLQTFQTYKHRNQQNQQLTQIPKSEVRKTNFSLQHKEYNSIETKHVINRESKTSWPVAELEQFLINTLLPTQPIKLNSCSTNIDVSKFVDTHLAFMKTKYDSKTYLSYLERLDLLTSFLILNNN